MISSAATNSADNIANPTDMRRALGIRRLPSSRLRRIVDAACRDSPGGIRKERVRGGRDYLN